jgi:hypothetical protein
MINKDVFIPVCIASEPTFFFTLLINIYKTSKYLFDWLFGTWCENKLTICLL